MILSLNAHLPVNVGTCTGVTIQSGIWTLVSATGAAQIKWSANGSSYVTETYFPNITPFTQNLLWVDLSINTTPESTYLFRFKDLCDQLNYPCGITYDITITAKNGIATAITTAPSVNIGKFYLDSIGGTASPLFQNGNILTTRGYLTCESNILKLNYVKTYQDSNGVTNEGVFKYTLPSQPSWSSTISGIANTDTIEDVYFGSANISINPVINMTGMPELTIASTLKSRIQLGLSIAYPNASTEILDMMAGLSITVIRTGTTSISFTQQPFAFFTGSPGSYDIPEVTTSANQFNIGTTVGGTYYSTPSVSNGSLTLSPPTVTSAYSLCATSLISDPANLSFSMTETSAAIIGGSTIFPLNTGYDAWTISHYFESANTTAGSQVVCNIPATVNFVHNRGAAADLTNFKITDLSNNSVVYSGASNSGTYNFVSPKTYRMETILNNGCVLTKDVTI